jgi:hypothetical protein
MEKKTGIELALEKFDNSPTKLAHAIEGSVIRQHVEHWLKAGKVPAEKAPDVMVASGVAVELLCPDTNWAAVRAVNATTTATPEVASHV